MSTDLRGFAYALEPLRRRQAWQLDALQLRLGAAQGRLDLASAEHARLDAALADAARGAGTAAAGRFDPARHQAALAFLAGLHEQLEAQLRLQQTRTGERDAARAACAAQQRRCDASERHREECLDQYQNEQRNRAMTEADSDWIARSGWRQRANAAVITYKEEIG